MVRLSLTPLAWNIFFFSGFLLAKDVGNTWYLVLTWNANTKTCFLKKLSFNVDITILILFYKTFIYLFISFIYFIQIMLTLCIQCWGGGGGGTLSEQNWTALLNSETR